MFACADIDEGVCCSTDPAYGVFSSVRFSDIGALDALDLADPPAVSHSLSLITTYIELISSQFASFSGIYPNGIGCAGPPCDIHLDPAPYSDTCLTCDDDDLPITGAGYSFDGDFVDFGIDDLPLWKKSRVARRSSADMGGLGGFSRSMKANRAIFQGDVYNIGEGVPKAVVDEICGHVGNNSGRGDLGEHLKGWLVTTEEVSVKKTVRIVDVV